MRNTLVEESKKFAIEIVKLSEVIKARPPLIDQLLRSGTSIGANIQEAQYAQSRADFISKLEISLKECYETEYWLEILNATGYIQSAQYDKLRKIAGNIRMMLIKACKTTKGVFL